MLKLRRFLDFISAPFPRQRFRTALFGALICLADTVQVSMLNMTYDVPVKMLSFHLVLMALFLLAPDLPRLANWRLGRVAHSWGRTR